MSEFVTEWRLYNIITITSHFGWTFFLPYSQYPHSTLSMPLQVYVRSLYICAFDNHFLFLLADRCLFLAFSSLCPSYFFSFSSLFVLLWFVWFLKKRAYMAHMDTHFMSFTHNEMTWQQDTKTTGRSETLWKMPSPCVTMFYESRIIKGP